MNRPIRRRVISARGNFGTLDAHERAFATWANKEPLHALRYGEFGGQHEHEYFYSRRVLKHSQADNLSSKTRRADTLCTCPSLGPVTPTKPGHPEYIRQLLYIPTRDR